MNSKAGSTEQANEFDRNINPYTRQVEPKDCQPDVYFKRACYFRTLRRLPCLHSPRWHLMQASQILTSGALWQPLDECNSRVCAFGCTSDHEPWLCCCIGEVFAHGKREYMSAQRMTSFANSRLTCHQARSESEQADDARTVIWPRGPGPLLTRRPPSDC